MRGHVMRNCRAQYYRAQNYWAIVPAALLAVFFAAAPLAAQTPGAFAGKTVTMYIGFGPGGGYDLLWGARGRPPYRRIARQPDRQRAKPGGRRQLPRRQFHLQRGAQGRHLPWR